MRPEIELRHLWYFSTVAEELNFSRAAVRIGIAQPPLSQQIQKLEATLGCALFDRTGRRVRLTEAGALLVGEARRLLSDAQHVAGLVRRIGLGQIGTLDIGFWSSVMFSPLPVAVRRFRERYPSVRVRMREVIQTDHATALRAGTIDVAVLREPEPEDGIDQLPILLEPFVAAVPADHRLARRRAICASLLRNEPFVLFPQAGAPGLHAKVLGLCRGEGFEPRVVQEAEAWHTIVSLVEAGIGVSLIPASFQGRRVGSLVYLPLTGPLRMTLTATVACARSTGRSRAADAFLEILAAEVALQQSVSPAAPAPPRAAAHRTGRQRSRTRAQRAV
jgi:DNA-binding transcriptional LysR family regulator